MATTRNIPTGELTYPQRLGEGGQAIVLAAMLATQKVAVKQFNAAAAYQTELAALERVAGCPFLCVLLGTTTLAGKSYPSPLFQVTPSESPRRKVVRVQRHPSSAGSPCLVLKRYDRDMTGLAAELGGIPFPLLYKYVGHVCAALAFLHERKIVLADLKPDNLLYDADADEAVISDLGIVRRIDADLTRVHTQQDFFGSARYMSPEQFDHQKGFGVAADVWALGATTIHLLDDCAPWEGLTLMNILNAVVNQKNVPTPRSDLPAPMRALLSECLQHDASQCRWLLCQVWWFSRQYGWFSTSTFSGWRFKAWRVSANFGPAWLVVLGLAVAALVGPGSVLTFSGSQAGVPRFSKWRQRLPASPARPVLFPASRK